MMYHTFENTVLREDVDEDLRLLLIGKTGSGKSATGNTIFNAGVFESEMRSSSVTRVCQTHTDAVHNRRVTVIDTPDFIFSTHTDFDSDSELKRALSLCSGAHVILLLLSLSTFTEQEMDFIAWFEQKFGEEALRFTLVLFTHADQKHMRSLGEMIRANTKLSQFINRCGQRYHEFNIKAPANRRQVTELMEKIDRLLSENTNSCYTLDMMLEIEKRREEEERRREEDERRREEEKEREHKMRLETVRRETAERVRGEYEPEILPKDKKEKRGEEKIRKECDAKQSKNILIYVFFGALVGAAFGAGIGVGVGVGVGAAFGAVGGAFVGGVGGGVVGNKVKGGSHSGTGTTSNLMDIEDAQSNKLS